MLYRCKSEERKQICQMFATLGTFKQFTQHVMWKNTENLVNWIVILCAE